jgi:hypothetical protein
MRKRKRFAVKQEEKLVGINQRVVLRSLSEVRRSYPTVLNCPLGYRSAVRYWKVSFSGSSEETVFNQTRNLTSCHSSNFNNKPLEN